MRCEPNFRRRLSGVTRTFFGFFLESCKRHRALLPLVNRSRSTVSILLTYSTSVWTLPRLGFPTNVILIMTGQPSKFRIAIWFVFFCKAAILGLVFFSL